MYVTSALAGFQLRSLYHDIWINQFLNRATKPPNGTDESHHSYYFLTIRCEPCIIYPEVSDSMFAVHIFILLPLATQPQRFEIV